MARSAAITFFGTGRAVVRVFASMSRLTRSVPAPSNTTGRPGNYHRNQVSAVPCSHIARGGDHGLSIRYLGGNYFSAVAQPVVGLSMAQEKQGGKSRLKNEASG